MRTGSTLLLVGAAVLAAACEAKIDNRQKEAGSNAQASAEGKSEEGRIALSMPGFQVKLDVPLDQAETDNDSKILYPGSRITGLHVDARADAGAGSDGEVELRFATADPPDKVAAWYRDPARAPDFSLSADGKDGAAFVLAGEEKAEGESFRLRLEAKGTGTDGRLLIRDRK